MVRSGTAVLIFRHQPPLKAELAPPPEAATAYNFQVPFGSVVLNSEAKVAVPKVAAYAGDEGAGA